MKDKDKLEKRRHHKLEDGSKNRKRRNRHAKVTQLSKDRQLSRDTRRENIRILNETQSYYAPDNFRIYFVVSETANNEKFLVEKVELSNGMYYIEFPVVDKYIVENNDVKSLIVSEEQSVPNDILEKRVANYIEERFNIEASTISINFEAKTIIVRNITRNDSNLMDCVVRTYNSSTWFDKNVMTFANGIGYYSRSNTDTYLASKKDLGDIIVSQWFLLSVLNYRYLRNKYAKFFSDPLSCGYDGTTSFFNTYFNDREMARLRLEKEEIMTLLYGEGKEGPIVQDIDRFLNFESIFWEKREKWLNTKSQYDSEMQFIFSTDNEEWKDYTSTMSQYYCKKRQRIADGRKKKK